MLTLPTCKGIEMINFSSIIRIEAVSNYSRLYFNDGRTLLVAKVLRWFEQQLPAEQFIRIHRTHIVNAQFIKQYTTGKSTIVSLQTGELITVAKRKRTRFLRYWYRPATPV
jgi:two-component system, LytTR family, response regulator